MRSLPRCSAAGKAHHRRALPPRPVRPCRAKRLARKGWALHAALSPNGHGGTAIAYRRRLRDSGVFAFDGGSEDAAVSKGPEGRYTAVRLRWSGHRLQLASIYLPSGDPTGQRNYIDTRLRPLAAAAGNRQLLWGGDFNFAPVPHLDRHGWAAGQHHQDTGTQQRWAAALPTLADVWRHRHPHRRGYTFLRTGVASRLDRFYASPQLLPRVAACSIGDRSISDHRPVALTLASLVP